MQLKRRIPTKKQLSWRNKFLDKASLLKPIKPSKNSPEGFEFGNSKTGKYGSLYNAILTWNLPPVVTCIGASKWCLTHCYNADNRKDKFPIENWCENWWWSLFDTKRLGNKLEEQLSIVDSPCAVRLHSCGDFYSKNYISFWINIIYNFPKIHFWAYTRSWIIDDFSKYLNKLNGLENMSLFASWDKSMNKLPPVNWRKSIVFNSLNDLRTTNNIGHICNEQFSLIANCASCGFCIRKGQEDILFVLH